MHDIDSGLFALSKQQIEFVELTFYGLPLVRMCTAQGTILSQSNRDQPLEQQRSVWKLVAYCTNNDTSLYVICIYCNAAAGMLL